MSRRNDSAKVVYLIVFGIIGVIIIGYIYINYISASKYKIYTNYVLEYSKAIETYSDKELGQNVPVTNYSYEELTNILKASGYLSDFKDSSVSISAEPIVLSKQDWKISYYNYYNTVTLENRFEIKFIKNGKEYTCTKNECK